MWLEVKEFNSPVSWWYEVETAVNAVILNLTTSHSRLFIQIILIFTINEVDDWLPAGERMKIKERGNRRFYIRGNAPSLHCFPLIISVTSYYIWHHL